MSQMIFLFRLIPARPDFRPDDDGEEQSGRWPATWSTGQQLLRDGKVVVYGPVADPEGVWGPRRATRQRIGPKC